VRSEIHASSKPRPAVPPAHALPQRVVNATVLLVDDSEHLLRVLEMYFQGLGLGVLTATSGKEALVQVEAGRPDAVVLDVMMPDINGIEVCRRTRANKRSRSIPVVILTANPDFQGPASKAGADRFMTKPFSLESLSETIGQLVGWDPAAEAVAQA
jgi:CheY-like chemotaxis protein